jgi:hypothetical protein
MTSSDIAHAQAMGMATKVIIERLMLLLCEKQLIEKSALAKLFGNAKSELEGLRTLAGSNGAVIVDFMAKSVLEL